MTDQNVRQERTFKGIGVSPGVARATVVIQDQRFAAPAARELLAGGVDAEIVLLDNALASTRVELLEMRNQLEDEIGTENALIFDAHLLLLEDQTVLDEVRRKIQSENQAAEAVYYAVISRYIKSLRNIADPYLSERAVDIEDVARRVMSNLRLQRQIDGAGGGSAGSVAADGAASVPTKHVLVSHDLTPSDTASMDRGQVLGFATELGSPTSHTAILSRSLSIPAVVGVHGLLEELQNGDDLLIDGYSGVVILSPSDDTLYQYDELEQRKGALRDDLKSLVDSETLTADGRSVTLSGNIEFLHELEQLKASGAEGVGLYRTEFFYLSEVEQRSEERQAEIYSEVARSVAPHEVIFRTLDVGGDKLMPELHSEPEPNPFLGWRGIRVSLDEPELFKEQLRAILRASGVGRVGVMYPFISSVEEVKQANALLDEAKNELIAREIDFDEDIQVGAMIEIPSAVVMADAIAAEVNFLSIGTNDLVQYTVAVDRINERVADSYQAAHPAVVRLMKQTVDAAHRNDIWAGVCGEVAGDLRLMPLMVGMEVDELSVGINQLLRVRRAISRLDTGVCGKLVDEVLQCSETAEVEELCNAVAREAYPELLQ